MAELHFERTADLMLEFLGSDGDPGWVFFRQFGEWELLFNLHDDRRLFGRLVRNLESRGLVESRRVSAGMQVRMTETGRQHCKREQARSAAIEAEFGPMLLDLPCQLDPAESKP